MSVDAFTVPLTTMRLVDPVTDTELFSVGAFTSTRLYNLELGTPDRRASATSIAGARGTWDTTRFSGARTVTAQMALPQGPAVEDAYDVLSGLCNNPGLRMWLYYKRPGWLTERRILVRGDGVVSTPAADRRAQASFVAPLGVSEAADALAPILVPTATAGGGFTFPMTFPVTFDSGLAPGAAVLTVAGNVPCAPVVDIYGPCANPLVRVVSTGDFISFPDLSIADGDFLRVDMQNRQAYLNGDPAQTRYSYFGFEDGASWWTLPTGAAVQVVFSADSVFGACQAVVTYRPTWI